jgi:hypothetical protein
VATPARLAEVADYSARVAAGDYADHVKRFGPEVQTIYEGMMYGHSSPDGFKWPRRPRHTMEVDPEKDRRADAEFRLVILTSAQDLVVVNRWRKHRIVYDVHPELAVELADSDPDSIIPAGLVRQLPHPDPFLALHDPIEIPLQNRLKGEQGVAVRILGAFMYGVTAERALVSTADSHAAALGLQFAQQVIDEKGRQVYSRFTGGPDFAWARMTLNLEEAPLRDAIADVLPRFLLASGGDKGLPKSDELVSKLINLVVPQVIYLCARNAETRPVPAVATKRKPDGTPWQGKPPRVIEVGYRLGPVLGKARKAYAKTAAAGSTGRVMPPHVRRAHYQRFWTGPKSAPQVPIVHWIAPTPVNVVKDDAEQAVVIGVK